MSASATDFTAEYDTAAHFDLVGNDGQALVGYRWLPERAPRSVVLLVHGMGEHAGRYGRFARVLTAAGHAVYAFDLRGHGLTAQRAGQLGHFCDVGGSKLVPADVAVLMEHAAAEHPGLDLLLFAHSMGTIFGQDFLAHHGSRLAAAIFSGPSGGNGVLPYLGEGLARLERLRVGPRRVSPVLELVAMGHPNKAFQPQRTEFDWLSRDGAEVDRFVADPLCGTPLTVQSWIDVSQVVQRIEQLDYMAAIPKRLPLLIFAGSMDPVGRQGEAPQWLLKRYRHLGLTDTELQLYPDGRHEMLNEINRALVHEDVLAFIKRVCG